jgi:hypothetical protein
MCLYATEMASPIPTFVHPASEAFSALSTSAALTYDNKESFQSVPATDTTVGSDGIDYTSLAEPDDVRVFHLKKVDSILPLGEWNGIKMIASYQSGGLEFEKDYVHNAHQYGYSKCQSYGRCDALQQVGSLCKGGHGYCYTSSTGTLECGRTVSTSRRFSSTEEHTVVTSTHVTLWAYNFVQYFSYIGGSMVVKGSVGPMTTSGTMQTFSYSLSGLDTACSMGPGTAANSCGIHVHAGKTCHADALGHYYRDPVTVDPWTAIAYKSHADGTATGLVNVDTGASSTELVGKAFIVHAYDGSRIGCALLTVSETKKPPVRCPRGTPADKGAPTNQIVNAKRFLIAGCMIMSDADYNPSAEVHVPSMCRVPADYMKGCGMPGALNFQPGSSQVGFCQYRTLGCTDPNSVNFSPYATENDGSCIVIKKGCTVKYDGYAGVESATPKYEKLYVGLPLRIGGVYDYPEYPSVVNYDSTANVLDGCVAAVEGCMDSTAKNYNPQATINTNTWCVPIINGCMMPTTSPAGDYVVTNFDPSATVNVKATCGYFHRGCRTVSAINYDDWASVDGPCWPLSYGCLDTGALNFGCDTRGTSSCGSLTNNIFTSSVAVTVHEQIVCVYDAGDLLTTAEMNLPENANRAMISVVSFKISGEITDYTDAMKAQLIAKYCAQLTLPDCVSSTTILIQVASVIVSFTSTTKTPAEGQTLQAELNTAFETIPKTDAVFNSVVGVGSVESVPYVQPLVWETESTGPVKKSSDNIPLIIGLVVGLVGGFCLLALLYYLYQRRKQQQSYAKTIVPA